MGYTDANGRPEWVMHLDITRGDVDYRTDAESGDTRPAAERNPESEAATSVQPPGATP